MNKSTNTEKSACIFKNFNFVRKLRNDFSDLFKSIRLRLQNYPISFHSCFSGIVFFLVLSLTSNDNSSDKSFTLSFTLNSAPVILTDTEDPAVNNTDPTSCSLSLQSSELWFLSGCSRSTHDPLSCCLICVTFKTCPCPLDVSINWTPQQTGQIELKNVTVWLLLSPGLLHYPFQPLLESYSYALSLSWWNLTCISIQLSF